MQGMQGSSSSQNVPQVNNFQTGTPAQGRGKLERQPGSRKLNPGLVESSDRVISATTTRNLPPNTTPDISSSSKRHNVSRLPRTAVQQNDAATASKTDDFLKVNPLNTEEKVRVIQQERDEIPPPPPPEQEEEIPPPPPPEISPEEAVAAAKKAEAVERAFHNVAHELLTTEESHLAGLNDFLERLGALEGMSERRGGFRDFITGKNEFERWVASYNKLNKTSYTPAQLKHHIAETKATYTVLRDQSQGILNKLKTVASAARTEKGLRIAEVFTEEIDQYYFNIRTVPSIIQAGAVHNIHLCIESLSDKLDKQLFPRQDSQEGVQFVLTRRNFKDFPATVNPQRPLRYVLLVAQLKKFTPPGDRAYKAISEANERVIEASNVFNKNSDAYGAQRELTEIESKDFDPVAGRVNYRALRKMAKTDPAVKEKLQSLKVEKFFPLVKDGFQVLQRFEQNGFHNDSWDEAIAVYEKMLAVEFAEDSNTQVQARRIMAKAYTKNLRMLTNEFRAGQEDKYLTSLFKKYPATEVAGRMVVSQEIKQQQLALEKQVKFLEAPLQQLDEAGQQVLNRAKVLLGVWYQRDLKPYSNQGLPVSIQAAGEREQPAAGEREQPDFAIRGVDEVQEKVNFLEANAASISSEATFLGSVKAFICRSYQSTLSKLFPVPKRSVLETAKDVFVSRDVLANKTEEDRQKIANDLKKEAKHIDYLEKHGKELLGNNYNSDLMKHIKALRAALPPEQQ